MKKWLYCKKYEQHKCPCPCSDNGCSAFEFSIKLFVKHWIDHHCFDSMIYFSFKDISIGLMIFSDKELIYGPKGRITGIEINLLFFHFRIALERHGF